MGFLRRLLGRNDTAAGDPRGADPDGAGDPTEAPQPAPSLDQLEREHELDVLRDEQRRLDELQQRQLRYEKYSWQPPAQGGEQRSDDADADPDRR